MDGSALYLCVAGAAVVAGIYVIWGPERLLRRKGNNKVIKLCPVCIQRRQVRGLGESGQHVFLECCVASPGLDGVCVGVAGVNTR